MGRAEVSGNSLQLEREVGCIMSLDPTAQEENMDDQPNLPLDERFRQAEQYSLDLQPTGAQQPATEVQDGTCPYHKAFVYECRYCNPR